MEGVFQDEAAAFRRPTAIEHDRLSLSRHGPFDDHERKHDHHTNFTHFGTNASILRSGYNGPSAARLN